MTAADRLRQAADKLEQTAATTQDYATDPWSGLVRDTLIPWVALMTPDLAAPLAAWLRTKAEQCAEYIALWEAGPQSLGVDDDVPPPMTGEEIAANVAHHWRHELAVANVILGGAS